MLQVTKMLDQYKEHCAERNTESLPPLPLTAEQTAELTKLLQNSHDESDLLIDLITNRVPAGVDKAAYVKASFLSGIAYGDIDSPYLSAESAVELLGTMLGGYNIGPLIKCLEIEQLAEIAKNSLSKTLLVFDAFNEVYELSKTNKYAAEVVHSWAEGTWFMDKPGLGEEIKLTVFKVAGEINTDDLSPAQDAWSRPDIPLHAKAMFKMPREGIENPLEMIADLKRIGNPIVFVGDVVGTGSSRKSATNSLLWHIGDDIPYIPNKRDGGFVLGGKIAPIFFNTVEDAGGLPIECDVTKIENGQEIVLRPVSYTHLTLPTT